MHPCYHLRVASLLTLSELLPPIFFYGRQGEMQLKCIINSEPDEELSFIAKFWVTGHQDQELLCFVTSVYLIISFSVTHHIIQLPHKTEACFILLSSVNV